MTVEMERFTTALSNAKFRPLNGKVDPFDLISTVDSSVGDAHEMMQRAGLFGWVPELIPLSGMDSLGHIYEAPQNARGIVVPQFPGGPAYFGQAGEGFKFQLPETIEDLVYTIAGHGTPLTGIQPGPITRLFFDHQIIDLADAKAQAQARVRAGEVGAHEVRGGVNMPLKVRWTVCLGNTGKNSLRISQHVTSLICANGLTTSAIMGAVSIAHSSLAGEKIALFVEDFGRRAGLGLERWIADAKTTMATRMSLAEADRLWTELFKWDDEKTGRARSMQQTQEARLHELWVAPTQQAHGSGTAWAFYNTVAEYLDHERVVRFNGGTRGRALAAAVVEGAPNVEATKNRAWEMALAAAAA